ncbi:MAG: exosortase E/protease, VPEID-CTERM system [Planctomycetaceae bacterium]|nr:exosortase E/protease, VPEID-CTERM system [Planctomycetaceae bacterium]
MQCLLSDDRAIRAGTRLIYVRWAALLALLVLEVGALTIRFEPKTLEGGPLWLEGLFDLLPVGFDVVAVGVVVMLLVQWPRLQGAWQCLPDRLQNHPWSRYLFVHLAGLAGLVLLSGPLLEGRPRSTVSVVALTICWMGLGLLSLLAWLDCFLPHREWLPLLRRWPWILPAGMAAGLGVLGAGRLAQLLWKPLGVSTLWLVCCILKLFSEDVVYLPAEWIIGTRAFDVEIAPACSGYEGMGLMLVLMGAFLLISRRTLRFPRALWLLPLGCLLAYLANAVRIAALILLGTHVSEDIALGGFHSRAGVLLFLAVGFGLIGLSLRSPLFSAADRQGEADVDSTASEAYLCPFMALVGITLVTGAFSSGFDPLYPLGLIVTCGLLWRYRKYYDDLCWTFAPQAVAIGVTVFALWIALEPWKSGKTPPTAPVPLAGAEAVAWVIARALGSVSVTPLVEELAFRGYLTRRLMAADFKSIPQGTFSWPSFLVSSSLFGILHDRWIAGIIAGMFYALALYGRRKLSDAVLAHATTNALIAAHVLASGKWLLWT